MAKYKAVVSRRDFFKLAALTAAAGGSVYALSGCTSSGATSSSAAKVESYAGQVVIDAKGNEFTIPEVVERIAITCNGGTTHEVAIFGGADKIVAQPSMKAFPQLLKMYPQFESVTNGGSFDDLNIEALLSAEPDVALVGISSDKGNAQIADVGIPIYVMLIGWAAVDTLKQEFLNVGKILGNEPKAEELVAHWDEKLASLQEMCAKVPDSERKKVYYISKPDITKGNSGDWGRTWVDVINADFAIPEGVASGDITIEKVLEWDPDVIIMQGGSDINQLYSDDRIKELKAIQNKQLYTIPIGGFWWDRPSPEATLGFMWLAQTVYPEYTKSIDLEKETKDFYKQFYDYDLPTDEYQSFF